ncbi:MAG: threonine/serine dehydratase [Deltaproteobacteria bacterium]|nr:threonine/serine dehydratase [Deltaproteobacteria bacterium]
MSWPITWDDVVAARRRIAPYLQPTPLRHYAPLDEAVGLGIRVLVKHENHLPTNAFKARNAIAFMTALEPAQKTRGVVAATRGNHGAGLAWAGAELGVPVVICVPHGNNPEKNAAMRGYGAELIEAGRDYDEAVEVAKRVVLDRGMMLAHSTNDATIIAGAATLGAELCEQAPELDAIVVAVGGGSQAVGSLVAARALRPDVRVYGVQAANAAAIHDSWHAKTRLTRDSAQTFADGLATRATYDLTWPALLEGLTGFVKVPESLIAEAIRVLMRTTHNLAEGAGAAGLAGLLALREELAGKTVAIVLSGSNIDEATLRRVITGDL